MTIELGDLTTLSQTSVDNMRAILAQRLAEAAPGQDYRRGVLGDLLLEKQAVLEADTARSLLRYKAAQSLALIEADPTLADDGVVDSILANWNVERRAGSYATGQVTIILGAQTPASVGAGTIFEANGVRFKADAAYAARRSAGAVIASTDRELIAVGDGTYAFTISVTASTPGVAGMLRRGTNLTTSLPIGNLLRVYAAADFTNGTDVETNAALLSRLRNGAAVATWGSRETVDSMLRQPTAFPDILQTSIVGYGDPEMLRDQLSVFPFSVGGRCDLYVRTQALPQLASVTKTATLVEKTANGGLWQITFEYDEVPAMYYVVKVLQTTDSATAGGYAVASDSRSFYRESTDPDVVDGLHGVYSRQQTVTVRFVDPDTSVTDLETGVSERDYVVVTRAMPNISEIQDFIQTRGRAPTMCDTLVKAPVPCSMSVAITIAKHPNQDDPDLVAIQNDVANAVNLAGFAGKITAAKLADTLHAHLTVGMAATYIQMTGKIRCPDGTFEVLRNTQVLTIPNKPEKMVTGRTTVFILEPQDVLITITTLGVPDV